MRILSLLAIASFALTLSGCKKQSQYDREWENRKASINEELVDAQKIVDNGIANPEQIDSIKLDKFIKRCEVVLDNWENAMGRLGTQAKKEIAVAMEKLVGIIMQAKAIQVTVNNRPSDALSQKAAPTNPMFAPKPVTTIHDAQWRGLEPKLRANVVEMEKEVAEYVARGTSTPAGLRALISNMNERIDGLRKVKPLVSEIYARQMDEYISRYLASRTQLQTALDTK
jgi:hypothetical protein